MSGYTIIWNGVPSTDIPEFVAGPVTRQLLGGRRHTLVDVPGMDGGWVFGEKAGRRTITVECFVLADSFPAGRRDAVTAVADWLDSVNGGDSSLAISDQPGVYYVGVLNTIPDVDEWRELGKFDLEWLCQPYSYAVGITTIDYTAWDSSESDTFDPDLIVETYPVITVNANGGEITEFSLVINDNPLSFTGYLADGGTLTINGLAEVVLTGPNTDTNLTGSYNAADLLMAGVSGFFPLLVPGTNSIAWEMTEGTATSVDISIIYRKRYRK